MLNEKIEQGIERFVGFVRRMNTLTDEQLRVLVGIKIAENPDHYNSLGIDVEGYVQFLRQMGMMSDDMIRKHLREEVEINKDPVYEEIFEDNAKKRAIIDMEKSAKEMKSDPRLFAKKVGGQGDSDLRNYIRKVA